MIFEDLLIKILEKYNKINIEIYLFSLYNFASDEFKEEYRLIDVFKKRILYIKYFSFNTLLFYKGDYKEININSYINNEYKTSDFFKELQNLYSFNYNTYLDLYFKNVLNKIYNDFLPISLYKNVLPNDLLNLSKFNLSKNKTQKIIITKFNIDENE